MTIDFDLILQDPRLLPYRGWHDDHRHHVGTPEYRPAAQQVRAEFMELVTALGSSEHRVRCLQIGLGVPGGTHLLLGALFVDVVTIEYDRSVSNQFVARYPLRDIMVGDSHSLGTRDTALARGPYDLLLIDGDHSRAGALADFRDYAPIVRPGGLVALHDAVCLSEVAAAVQEIRDSGRDVRVIGDEVGLAMVRITA